IDIRSPAPDVLSQSYATRNQARGCWHGPAAPPVLASPAGFATASIFCGTVSKLPAVPCRRDVRGGRFTMWGLDDFRGTWQAVWLEADGRVRPAEETRKTRVMVSSDRYVLRLRGHDFQGIIIRADPAQGPNAVDFLRTGGVAGAGERFPGIYLLEGDE